MYLTTVCRSIGCLVAIFWDNFKQRQRLLASGDILGYISRKFARSFSSYYFVAGSSASVQVSFFSLLLLLLSFYNIIISSAAEFFFFASSLFEISMEERAPQIGGFPLLMLSNAPFFPTIHRICIILVHDSNRACASAPFSNEVAPYQNKHSYLIQTFHFKLMFLRSLALCWPIPTTSTILTSCHCEPQKTLFQ